MAEEFMEKSEIEQYHELDNKIRRVIIQQLDKIQKLRVGNPFSGTIEFYYFEDENLFVHTKNPNDDLEHVHVIHYSNLLNNQRIEELKKNMGSRGEV